MSSNTLLAVQRTYMASLRTCAVFAGLSKLTQNTNLLLLNAAILLFSLRDYVLAYYKLKEKIPEEESVEQTNFQMYGLTFVLVYLMVYVFFNPEVLGK